ncbi:MAG TPA: thermonuclease family protein [Baekduia sp.]|nr:thermonuclease family protein [Baekduia sp.]
MLRRLVPLILVVLLAGAYGYTRIHDEGDSATTARVVRAVDGDTIVVSVGGGRQERVRYIGVDTPETVKPGAPVQCFGKYASKFNHLLVDGREVRLVVGAEARDRYGRLLAYVYRAEDGMFVNAELVRDGYAKPLTIPPNDRYADRFRALATEARRAGRGLWNACPR